YNSYMGPLLYLSQTKNLWTIQMMLQSSNAIYSFRTSTISWLATKAVVGMIPLVIVYLFGQKFFINGITAGAVKG
ncbi:MAG: carbohydrate ABC transporter permease, partial [Clostridia bacterium]|nr:carbohydrate ABC transporter permease [Clostridia bacterium]